MAGNKGVVASAVLVAFLGVIPLAQMITDTAPNEPVAEVLTTVPPIQAPVVAVAPTQDIDGLTGAVAGLLRERGAAQSVDEQDIEGQLPTAVVKLLSDRGAVLTVPDRGDAP